MLSTFIEKYGSSLTMESSVSFVINFWINFLVNAICGMGFLSSLLPGHFPVVENPLSPHPRPGHSPLSRSIVVHFLWVMFALSTSEGAGNDGNFTRNSCKRFCDLFFNEAKTAIITIQRYAKLTRLHTGGWRGMEWDGVGRSGMGGRDEVGWNERWKVADGQVGGAIFYVFPLLSSPFDEGFCGLRQPNCLCFCFCSSFLFFLRFPGDKLPVSRLLLSILRVLPHTVVCVIYIAEIKF